MPEKPGPPPQCACGECRVCQTRAYRKRYYERNREELIRRHVEHKRQRNAAAKAERVPALDDMDKRALMAWPKEWGAR